MDFARKQLLKYGWTDGKGLGKHENGISEALKPKLKRSVAGMGYDAASDFTEHWWSQLYDKAAGNVEVEETNGKTKRIKTKDSDGFEITNSTWKLNRKKKTEEDGEYSEHFVRKSILTSDGSKVDKVAESDSEEEVKKDVFKMSDEELFAACEGRTAHKGARHGLKALGKLARIAQQEQVLLLQPQYRGYSHADKLKKVKEIVECTSLNSDFEEPVSKKKKKKRKRCTSLNSVGVSGEPEKDQTLAESQGISLPAEVSMRQTENVASDMSFETISRNKSKSSVENVVEVDDIQKNDRKSSKMKKRKDFDSIDVNELNNDQDDSTVKKRKKKKHKKFDE
ncbi:G patch domain-containing protein 4 [Plodia interpunctella]|uniref:G patch domain-containing protein 4 n=1 Tax=Plodia interpunctella TaxID=58824 RepID=UPI0023675A5D|nr:G patch domain-containing protein 4 [Plodia interpunctella]